MMIVQAINDKLSFFKISVKGTNNSSSIQIAYIVTSTVNTMNHNKIQVQD